VFGDLKGLKDDNARLQKAIKDSKSGKEDLREMIDKYEWLQKQEKQMKEEVMALHDRCKGLKAEVNRKDSQIREIKEKVDTKYIVDADLKEVSSEIGKLKDVIKRNKLDLEIKENQIRALKQRLEQASEKPLNSGASTFSD
jgi:chromosome segregation ATPase